MFLVTPKRKANVPPGSGPDPDPTPHQPLAKITKASRVQNACDRCRLKKVKVRWHRDIQHAHRLYMHQISHTHLPSATVTGLAFDAPKTRLRA
jgi:hypothetical protein